LFAAFIAEHSMGEALAADLNPPVSQDEPTTHYNQTDPIRDF
jgi:hypothetical protein